MPPSADRRDVGADEHEIGAERLHHVELPLGAVEGLGALRLGHALEVAERLEQRDARPASRTIAPTSAGEWSEARKSFSKISTPSKPAAAMASSFSTRSPLSETVAMLVRNAAASAVDCTN